MITSNRYVAMRRAFIADDCYFEQIRNRETIVAAEDIDAPVKTGLLDAQGNELYRVKERGPLGFVTLREDG